MVEGQKTSANRTASLMSCFSPALGYQAHRLVWRVLCPRCERLQGDSGRCRAPRAADLET
eukprot:scaffold417_cov252-Pinguiococcus_pyrenoidosus.AAC.25